jgi:hypothetical protein
MPLKKLFKHKYVKLSYILDLKLQAKSYDQKKNQTQKGLLPLKKERDLKKFDS